LSPKDIPSALKFPILLLPKLFQLTLTTMISALLLPIFWLGWLIWYRPPNVVYLSQVRRYLGLVWTVDPPAPGLGIAARIWLTLLIIQKMLMAPIVGTAWLLDELLYGRKLDQILVENPLLVISGGRSGSTQITRYLEEDPNLAAPNILMCMFPYLWLWKLAPVTLGRLLTPDQVRVRVLRMMPPELIERHESDPFKADTFDGSFLTFHLTHRALDLGPKVGITEFSFAEFTPRNRSLFEEDFVNIVERIGRKTLLYLGPNEDGNYPRFMLKGHFLLAAPALARHFPEANFLTVVREPLSRLQSGINYLRVNPPDPLLGPVPWEWLTTTLTETESRYCEVEQAWFSEEGQPNRCVIRFNEFVADLPAAMGKVYYNCCGMDTLPPHIPAEHPPRERKNYTVNRSLEDLGVDELAIKTRLANYIEWVK
jgi:hypothetical protein